MRKLFIQNQKKVYIGLTLLIFILLRIVAWNNVKVVEDHDSIYYLSISKLISNLDLNAITEIGPDATFLYPLFIAVFNLPGWFPEFGARLVSLSSSILLFLSLFKLGSKINNNTGTILCLLILSFNPFFINFSVSILTEPFYITNIYFGLWYFLKYLEKPSFSKAFLLGIIFGLSFLNRTEGVVFLAFIPFIIIANYLLFNKKRDLSFSYTVKGTSLFILGFLLLSIPQVWRTSSKMGTFAINGRQVWQTILHTPDGRSYDEKLRGLDYSEKDINLKFLQSNHHAYQSLGSDKYIRNAIKNIIEGFNKAYSFQISMLVGIIVLMTFGMGIISLISDKRIFELFFFFIFTIVILIPPLFHNFDLIRHIALVGPIFMLLSGIGISFLSTKVIQSIDNEKIKSLSGKYLAFFLFLLIPFSSLTPIYTSLKNPAMNREYSPTDLSNSINALRKSSNDKFEELIIISRKNYFPYYAGNKRVDLPFTTYEKLVRYARLNKANYIYLQSNEIENYPYGPLFLKNKTPDFELVYSAKDKNGQKVFLYRLK